MKTKFMEINSLFFPNMSKQLFPPTSEVQAEKPNQADGLKTRSCPLCKKLFPITRNKGARVYCEECVPAGFRYYSDRQKIYKKNEGQSLTSDEKMPTPTPVEAEEPQHSEEEKARPTFGVPRSSIMKRVSLQLDKLDDFFDKIGSTKKFTKQELLRQQADFLDTSSFIYNWLKYEVEGE